MSARSLLGVSAWFPLVYTFEKTCVLSRAKLATGKFDSSSQISTHTLNFTMLHCNNEAIPFSSCLKENRYLSVKLGGAAPGATVLQGAVTVLCGVGVVLPIVFTIWVYLCCTVLYRTERWLTP